MRGEEWPSERAVAEVSSWLIVDDVVFFGFGVGSRCKW